MTISVALTNVRVDASHRKVITFISFTFVLSAIVWALLALHVASDLLLTGLAMWCPGLAAILTRLIYQHHFKGMGWRRVGKLRYLLLGAALPLAYGLLTYGITWWSGLGGFSWQAVRNLLSTVDLQGQAPNLQFGFFIFYAVVLIAVAIFAAAGEEIGWRGLLVPEMAKMMPFSRTALISGIIWSIWHYPLIILTGGSNGLPLWYALCCFTIMITALSVMLAWLRLESRALWPAVLLHAAHNTVLQQLFNPLTVDSGLTKYIVNETGIGLATVTVIFALAVVCWKRKQARVRSPARNEELSCSCQAATCSRCA
jgi:uncharacterized protein